jgi:hypothetical protein
MASVSRQEPPAREASQVDKGDGRLEKRTLRTTTILTLASEWSGVRQGFEVRRERTVKGQTTVEVSYGITSLTPEEADASRLLERVRAPWRIENQRHYIRDVTLREDACRVRSGSTPQVLACRRNAVVDLLGRVPAESTQAAIEQMQMDVNKAGQLIGLPQIE